MAKVVRGGAVVKTLCKSQLSGREFDSGYWLKTCHVHGDAWGYGWIWPYGYAFKFILLLQRLVGMHC